MTSLKNLKASRAFTAAVTAFILLLASTSNATITLSSISGVSRADPIVAGNASLNIYGGMAPGNGPGCDGGTATCDSCPGSTIAVGTDFAGCNNNMINNNTLVEISYTSTVQGYPVVFSGASGNTTAAPIPTQSLSTPSGTQVAAGSLIVLYLRWGDICGGACSTTAITQISFVVGVSTSVGSTTTSDSFSFTGSVIPTMTGVYEVTSPACPGLPDGVICTYVAYPGDSKVTLQNQDGEDNYPALANGSSIKALRLYYYKTANTTVAQEISNPVDFANITPAGGYAELPVDSSGNIIGNGRITGLENNGVYVFKMAHVDQAGNVGLFVANDAGATSDLMCATSDQTCHIAEPGAVEGILAKDLNCFIATAAYGSPFASKVQTFRAFRNKFLLHSYLGKKFIHFYYFEFGPNAADFIRHSDALRAMSRTALYPLWLFAKLSLELGFFGALCVSLGIFGLLIATARVCSQHLRMDA